MLHYIVTQSSLSSSISLSLSLTRFLFSTEKTGQCGIISQQCEESVGTACAVSGSAQLCSPPAGGTEGHGEQDRRHLSAHRDHVLQT